MESRGNEGGCGLDHFGSTLHWGPSGNQDAFMRATKDFHHEKYLSDDFHVYAVEWNEGGVQTFIDGDLVLNTPFDTDMWSKGGFQGDNIWAGQGKQAPFNKDFFLVFNVAVGGTAGFFHDGDCNKPWNDGDPNAKQAFLNAKN
jgi:hypothetical protein